MSQDHGTHIVKSKVFEVSFNVEKEGINFQKELSELVRDELNRITEKCLAHFDSQVTHYIHKIELNLRDVPYEDYKQVLPQLYEERLMSALSEKLSNQGKSVDSSKSEVDHSNGLATIRYYLIKGYMPWNFNKANWNSFNDLFQHSFNTDQIALLKELDLLLKSEAARIRLVNSLSSTIIKSLIRKVEPSQAELIITYHKDWVDIQKQSATFKSSENELSKRFWLFILNYLYEERGSYFNTRTFLIGTLRQVAAHFNVSFEFAVSLLQDSYNKEEQTGSRAAFHSIIGDILKDYHIVEADKNSERNESEAVSQDIIQLEEILRFTVRNSWSRHINYTQSKYEKSIRYFIDKNPADLLQLIKKISGSFSQVYRLIKPLDEHIIHRLTSVLSPGNQETIIAYHERVVTAQRKEEFIPTPGSDFSKVIWSIIIPVIADNHGSTFNHKSFIRALVHRIAQHFNVGYKELLFRLRSSLKSIINNKIYTKAFILVDEIYLKDFGKPEQYDRIKSIRLTDIPEDWLIESIINGQVSKKLKEQGFGDLKELLRLYGESIPDKFFLIIKEGFSENEFEKNALKILELIGFKSLIKGSKNKEKVMWLSTLDVLEKMPTLELLNPVGHQRAIRHFLIRWIIGHVVSGGSSIERQVISLSVAHGLDFNELVKSFLWVAEESHNKALEEAFNTIAGKYKISSRKAIRSLAKSNADGKKEEDKEAARIDQLVIILLSGIHGIFDKRVALKLGFRSVDDVLTYLRKHKPDRLRRALGSLQMETHPFVGIGREVPLTSFYAMLVALNGTEGRFLVNLLRRLDTQLNLGSQSMNRFLSAARSLALVNLSKRSFNLGRFLEDFTSLILSTSPSVYIQVIPVLTKNLSTLSLPGSGNTQSAIQTLEKNLSNALNITSPMDKESLKNILEQEFFPKTLPKESSVKPYFEESCEAVFDEIFIENAGLVIVNSYLPILFERCGLTKSNTFLSSDHQQKAALLIQYLLLDKPPLDEHHLPFNKLLCGLPLASPINTSMVPTADEMKIVRGLIKAVIEHWTSIGQSSIDGFRGSWLWRKGKLEHKEEQWELHVEQNTYDMLLDRLPFSMSPIKYSWMEKPLIVNWR